MALQKQVVPVALTGLQTKKTPQTVIPGEFTLLNNMYQQRTGEFRKRNGVTALSASILAGGTISDARQLHVFRDELLLQTDTSIYSYSEAGLKWSNKGGHPPVSVAIQGTRARASTVHSTDAAYGSGLIATVFAISNGLYYSVVDAGSGQELVTYDFLAVGTRGQVIPVSDGFVILYLIESGGSATVLKARKILASDPTAINSPVDVATDGRDVSIAPPFFDAILVDGTIKIALVKSATELRMVSWTPSTMTAASSAVDTIGVNVNQCLGWLQYTGTNGSIYLAFATSAGGVSYRTYTASTLVASGSTLIDATTTDVRNVTGYMDGGAPRVWYEYVTGTSRLVRRSSDGVDVYRKAGLASKMFTINGGTYVLMTYDSTLQSTYFLVSTTGEIVARIAPSTAGGYVNAFGHTSNNGLLPRVTSISATEAVIGIRKKTGVTASNGSAFLSNPMAFSCRINFEDSTVGHGVDLGGLALPGGLPRLYDSVSLRDRFGVNVTQESGFLLYPEGGTASASGAGAMPAGVYQYVFVYSWIDALGNLHRSAPSTPVSVTAGGATALTLAVPNLTWTLRTDTNTYTLVEIYRTEVNGVNFYKLNALPNVPTTDTTAYVDTLPDSTLIGYEPLYTTDNVLENMAIPACRTMAIFKNRLFFAGLEDSDVLGYSKEMREGFGIASNDLLRLRLDDGDRGIYALAAMDEKLIAFKRNGIWVISGDGPDDKGGGGTFFSQRIPGTIGCAEPRSVVVTDQGIFFNSPIGIYLLTRGLELQYIGAPREFYHLAGSSYSPVDACVMQSLHQVRFASADSTFVYDWHHGVWSVFTGHAAVSAALWQGQYVFAKSNGVVVYEDIGSYSDLGTTAITTTMTISLTFAGILGFQRVYEVQLMGASMGNHTLTAYLSYDHTGTVVQTISRTILNGAEWGQMIRPSRQKCASLQISLVDSGMSTGNAGFRLVAMSALVGIKNGLRRLPATQRLA